MIVLCLRIKRHYLRKVVAAFNIPDVVEHDIDHDFHAPLVRLEDQAPQVGLIPEVRVHPVDVLRPVPVVATVRVLHVGRDLEGVEAEDVGDVGEQGDQVVEGAPAVLIELGALGGPVVGEEAVCEDMVDGSGPPV